MSTMGRIIVVGLGSIGRRHVRLLAARGDLQVGICERDPARLRQVAADYPGVDCYPDYADALASRPDYVLIATPPRFHADQTIAALEAGAHVLCEKPICDVPADAERMGAAATRSGRVLTVGFMLHFHPGLEQLKAWVDAGELGELLHVHCRVGSYITLQNSESRYQTEQAGSLLLDYTHQPDLVYWLTGQRPSRLYMLAKQAGDLPLSSNPNVLALSCDYASSLLTTIHLNYVQSPERHEYELVGDRGWAMFDLNTGVIRLGRRDADAVVTLTVPTERDGMYRRMHQAFLDAAAGRQEPESPAASASVSLRVVDAALASRRESRPIELTIWP